MAKNLGTGVSRTLDAATRQFIGVVFQEGKPPLDSEFNLQDDIHTEIVRSLVKAQMPSGWLMDPMRAKDDYQTNKLYSNLFKLGKTQAGNTAPVMWAVVNGWMVPIAGTNVSTEGDMTNVVKLNPPQDTDQRTDMVFLEVWQCAVAPNTSTANKPSATTIYKYGNTQYGGSNIADDLEDPEIKFETTERVQVQYRLRVVGQGAGGGTNVTLSKYPSGLDDPNVYGQGTGSVPQTTATYRFTNQELNGDPGLWRSGDGTTASQTALGTIDGYVYAIPVCAIFRRNSNGWLAVNGASDPDQNGSVTRSPGAVDTTNAKVLSTATITTAITATTTGVVDITSTDADGTATATSLDGTFLDDGYHAFSVASPGYLKIGSEIIQITDANAGEITIPATGGRGRGGSTAIRHEAGTEVTFYNARPDGLYADEVTTGDILDLRHAVSAGEWDYQRLLIHNLGKLVRGTLQSTWKQAAQGDARGPIVPEVSYSLAAGAVNNTEKVDGPDGIRSIFSDSACLQTDVSVFCHRDPNLSDGNTTTTFDLGSTAASWGIGADLKHFGFYNNPGGNGYKNGTVVFLPLGGTDGNGGARAGLADLPAADPKAVRFVSPREYWKTDFPDATTGKQHPISLRFLGEQANNPAGQGVGVVGLAKHPGAFHPLKSTNFERPFIVLGGVVHADLAPAGNVAAADLSQPSGAGNPWELDTGITFTTGGVYYGTTITSLDPADVSKPMLGGTRTLYDLLTNGGKDETGNSSELYCVVWGDDTDEENNGAFKVVGVGNGVATTQPAASATKIRMIPLTSPTTITPQVSGETGLKFELRTQHMSANDGIGGNGNKAAVCVVLTDITGAQDLTSKFGATTLVGNALSEPVDSHMVINTTLLYGPGRGGTARVAGTIHMLGTVGTPANYLREAESVKDAAFMTDTGGAAGESHYDPVHVQVWNRLPSKGLPAPDAPAYGGAVVSFSEQDREHELFVDEGSKTVIFRPMQRLPLTMQANILTAGATDDVLATLLGTANYGAGDTFDNTGIAKDTAGIFRAGLLTAFPLPPEVMPKFGRQDIPYCQGSAGQFLPGINHLFVDTNTATNHQYNIIGGNDTPGGGITSMHFDTAGATYGQWLTIPVIGGPPAVASYTARRTATIGTGTVDEKAIRKALADVHSSDLGSGLSGIQLPPYLGIARLYGVYERTDYINQGGATFTDRVTLAANPATNLLKTDVDQQTLFIMQDGAKDLTGESGDHTYIIPSHIIDHSKAPNWVAQTFDDYEYVVECVVFGFAKEWINGNNYVMARKTDGDSNALAGTEELLDVDICVPWAPQLNQPFYTTYTRPVYQGDPFMSRSGLASADVNDYARRYGQIPLSAQWAEGLSKVIQQYDPTTGAMQIETPNPRSLEVLSSVNFYTTLGTGKIGGALAAGTGLDVGHTANTAAAAQRWPTVAAADATTFHHVDVRAFTAGQTANTSRATATLEITDNANIWDGTNGVALTITLGSVSQALTAMAGAPTVNRFNEGAADTDTAVNIAAAINLSTSGFTNLVTATANGRVVTLTAVPTGAKGNSVTVSVSHATTTVEGADVIKLGAPTTAMTTTASKVTKINLAGGVDSPVNAGMGASQLALTGMTERLPLGILVQDSDFLCENPLEDNASALRTSPSGLRPVQSALPLTANGGKEYTRFYGEPGELIGMAEGSNTYLAYHATDRNSATKKFRINRGGGSVYVMSGDNPGGPIDWASDSLPASASPVLKGGVLACKALLVRNFKETPANGTVVHGGELQMVVVTHAKFADGTSTMVGIDIDGTCGPTGYGEGYAAADRYRLEGLPLVSSHWHAAPNPDHTTNTDLSLAPFPER